MGYDDDLVLVDLDSTYHAKNDAPDPSLVSAEN